MLTFEIVNIPPGTKKKPPASWFYSSLQADRRKAGSVFKSFLTMLLILHI